MFAFLRRWNGSRTHQASETFAGDAVWQLDKAMMILSNAKTLHSADDIKRSIDRAVEEIEPVFQSAMRTCAKLRGMPNADVG